ncbi:MITOCHONDRIAL GROUP I INTRON SPLICING FACTOR CCM1 [Salix purpurea]|uniref:MITOCHONDRIAL GROUP I INTRON SPLICING FACTOR CCM1 n=1 Tax=Salix purpurea TaxID=77065 RepID=A0A9Q0SIQ2_SALPP|nr:MITOCHONDRIAL GROUP I INTRON SPLICING FACTOR CCM1 [Salix purpurea]
MLRHSPIPSPSPLLSSLRKSIHWKPRHESNLPRPELHDRISRLLILRRFDALEKLNFHFSDSLVDSILVKLKLNPEACLNFFQLATKQPNFTPDVKSYCKLVHILSRARMYDETRSYLNELACLCKNNYTSFLVFDELVRIYKDFKFSPLVFDMILKVYAEKGMVKNALHVFDNMGKYGRKPSLRSCNSLLSNLAKRGESYTAVLVYDQMRRLDIVPDVFTRAIMVNVYCKAGKVERAVEFVKEMEKLGFELNVVSYNSLVDGYVSLGDVERGERGFEVYE